MTCLKKFLRTLIVGGFFIVWLLALFISFPIALLALAFLLIVCNVSVGAKNFIEGLFD